MGPGALRATSRGEHLNHSIVPSEPFLHGAGPLQAVERGQGVKLAQRTDGNGPTVTLNDARLVAPFCLLFWRPAHRYQRHQAADMGRPRGVRDAAGCVHPGQMLLLTASHSKALCSSARVLEGVKQ